MKPILLFAALLAAQIPAADSASVGQKKILVNIAVVDLVPQGLSAAEAVVLSDQLREEFIKTGAFSVIERGQMEEILKEQAFQQTGCTSSECVVEIGQLIGVDKIASGTVGKVGSYFVISVRIVDVRSGRVLVNESEKIKGTVDDIVESGMRRVAEKVYAAYTGDTGLLEQRRAEERKATPDKPPSVDRMYIGIFGSMDQARLPFRKLESFNLAATAGTHAFTVNIKPPDLGAYQIPAFGMGLKYMPARWLRLEAGYCFAGLVNLSGEYPVDITFQTSDIVSSQDRQSVNLSLSGGAFTSSISWLYSPFRWLVLNAGPGFMVQQLSFESSSGSGYKMLSWPDMKAEFYARADNGENSGPIENNFNSGNSEPIMDRKSYPLIYFTAGAEWKPQTRIGIEFHYRYYHPTGAFEPVTISYAARISDNSGNPLGYADFVPSSMTVLDMEEVRHGFGANLTFYF